MYKRQHLEDADGEPGVRSLDEDNRVLNEGDTVSMEKLMGLMKKRRNSILVLIGTGSVGSEVPVSYTHLIRSWDKTLPTDNNLFSARRSQKEFLNKNRPDTAK